MNKAFLFWRCLGCFAIFLFSGFAFARGASEIKSAYPVALSTQIEAATVTDADLADIKAAGYEFVRFGVRPGLKSVNPNLVNYENLIQRIKKIGLRSVVTIFGGTEVWGSVSSDVSNSGSSAEQNFSRFATQLIAKNINDVAVWELWNEPDIKTFLNPARMDTFAAAVEMLCANLQKENLLPDVFVGFGFAKFPYIGKGVPKKLEASFAKASREGCFTDISVHPYRTVPETVIEDYKKMRGAMDRLGLNNIGIIDTEWGYSSYFPVRSNEDQAALLMRQYLSNVSSGIKLMNVYSWRDRGGSRISREDNFGVVSMKGEKKPTYFALVELLKLTRGATSSKFDGNGGVNKLVFTLPNSSLSVLWVDAGEKSYRMGRVGSMACEKVEFVPAVSVRPCVPSAGDAGEDIMVSSRPVAILTRK